MKIYYIEGDQDGMLVKYVVVDIDEKGAKSLIKTDHLHVNIDVIKLIGNASQYESVPRIICSEEP